MGTALYGSDAACMAILAVSADKWEGTARANRVDTAVMIIQLVALAGEWLSSIVHEASWCFRLSPGGLNLARDKLKIAETPSVALTGNYQNLGQLCTSHEYVRGTVGRNVLPRTQTFGAACISVLSC